MSSNLPAVRGSNGELVTYSLPDVLQIANMLVESKLLPVQIKTPQQAAIIILKGLELGLMPLQATEDIFVVNGKPSLGTKLMVSLWRRAGHDYRILERNADHVTIQFKLRGGQVYDHTLTMEEAVQAKWDIAYDQETKQWKPKPLWKQIPAIMLTYRCFSTGIRMLDPSVLQSLRTQDEAHDVVSPDLSPEDDVVDGVAHEIADDDDGQGGVQNLHGNGTTSTHGIGTRIGPLLRPYPPDVVIEKIKSLATNGSQEPAEQKARGAVVGALEALFEGETGEIKTAKRHGLLRSFFGTDTSKTLTEGQCQALFSWSREKLDEEGCTIYAPSVFAAKEAAAIIALRDEAAEYSGEAAGQERMFA
jgi:hypothetical protein